jgi:hypothetical protein
VVETCAAAGTEHMTDAEIKIIGKTIFVIALLPL